MAVRDLGKRLVRFPSRLVKRFVSRQVVNNDSTYTIQAGDTFTSVATRLGISADSIQQANPGVDPSKLQVGQVIQLPSSGSSQYTIQGGDTLSSIASKFGTTMAAIQASNPGINPNNLKIGAIISIPAGSTAASAQPNGTANPQSSPAAPAGTGIYIIKAGDTLSSIAANIGATVAALEAENPGMNPNNLLIGGQLNIPTSNSVIPAPPEHPPTIYIIQPGDTFITIAAKFGTTVAALEAANPGLNPNNLQVGGVILNPWTSNPAPVVPPPLAPTPPPAASNTYTIAAGDTFDNIANQFGISVPALQAANPSVNPTSLQVGQVINLPSGSSTGIPNGMMAPDTSSSGYVAYSGPASNFPSPSQWASYDTLWAQNIKLMGYNDTFGEIAFIGQSILTVSSESGIDPRVILCIIMQESGGNVRVGNTFNGIVNTGIMQAFNGVSFNPGDPQGSILQMVRDGAEGSSNGPGLKQAYQEFGNWYEAARKYNSGSVDRNELGNALGATAKYVTDFANRLMGHTWAGM